MNIPFNEPFIEKEEEKAIVRALRQKHLRGDGPSTQRVQEEMEEWLGVDHVLMTTSCTHALEMAMMVLGIKEGDEVIMPSFNFVSSANAVVLRGAKPIFAEIRPETMNIDPVDIERKINNRTKAIVPVHYAGVSCDMDAIMDIAAQHDLYVVEDAAQGIDAYYNMKPVGTIGDIGCYSFHDTKNITCGEGGAFITNNDEIARKAEIIREKGTNRAAFIRGEVDKYTWVSEGSSYIPSDILMSLLEAQLEKRKEIKSKRRQIWQQYMDLFSPYADVLRLPVIPEGRDSNYHIFHFLADSEEQQQALIDSFKEEDIPATFHYVPLHSAPFFESNYEVNNFLKRTQKYSDRLIRLPLYPGLEANEFYFSAVKKAIERIV
ncbi:dTDP-4-amino-4,6-dideoxygalactose transaminase [Fodinibius halophilus]|uniref:dTDP-4-amino-4,6-dideoxygalactose transaminase n=1 Tax=Fodinibius halophilus TaxID=1736908 RepID=A0A6M1TBR9_9BACT|nr:dTDP-4-amino-4,6-dideoxygalactose transaminase [Fodinibius halophilus]NGP89793.1 dTDP-4-amino-4,6-dideoxygalactose transaminase [Fodinibius halophilus]